MRSHVFAVGVLGGCEAVADGVGFVDVLDRFADVVGRKRRDEQVRLGVRHGLRAVRVEPGGETQRLVDDVEFLLHAPGVSVRGETLARREELVEVGVFLPETGTQEVLSLRARSSNRSR